MAHPLDETVSMASSDSDNADHIYPGGFSSSVMSFLGHVHTYRSAVLKLNTDLA